MGGDDVKAEAKSLNVSTRTTRKKWEIDANKRLK